MGDLETPFDYARREGELVYQTLTGRRIGQTTRRDRAGNIVGTGNQAQSSRTGTEQDFIDTGIASEGTGGTRPQQTFTARQKYMEYLDDLRNLQQLERLGRREGDRVVFPNRQLQQRYLSAGADVVQYQNDNTDCDQGNKNACNRAGRGNAPTDYASPFQSSQHFDDVAYFSGGGKTKVIPARGTGVEEAPAPAPAPAPEPEPEPAPEPPPAPEPEPAPQPEIISEPVEPETNVDTGSSSSIFKPKHKEAHDPYSGGGTHSGSDHSASHEPHGVHNFDTGGTIDKLNKKDTQSEINRQELINIQALRNPYGEYKCPSGKRLVSGF